MSATIISHEGFSLTLGLPFNETLSIKEGSPFPVENRPIIFSSCGSMSFKNLQSTLPNMIKAIDSILDNHKNEKGIIHTHSIKIAESIYKKLSRKYKNRILIAFGSDRDKILKKHMTSKIPTVLLSPSMAEGVDLKGDLSKFQTPSDDQKLLPPDSIYFGHFRHHRIFLLLARRGSSPDGPASSCSSRICDLDLPSCYPC